MVLDPSQYLSDGRGNEFGHDENSGGMEAEIALHLNGDWFSWQKKVRYNID